MMRITSRHIRCLLILVFAGSLTILYAQKKQTSKATLQEKVKKLETEIQYNTKLLSETRKDQKANQNQLSILNDLINKRDKLIKTINNEISAVNSDIRGYEQQIVSLENEIKALKKEYAQMIVATQRQMNSSEKLMFIVASENFNQAYRRLKYFQQYSAHRKEQVALILQKQEELNRVKTNLEQDKQTKTQLLSKEEQEKKKLDSEKSKKNQAISELKKKEKKLREDIKRSQAEARKLEQQIERIIKQEIEARKRAEAKKAAEEAAKKGKTTKPTTKPSKPDVTQLTPEEQKLSDDFVRNRGKLPWPTERGVITGHFGKHEHPLIKGIIVENAGIDIATAKGEPVRAVFNGVVTGVFRDPYGGTMVIVLHGNYRTVYANLKSVNVKEGQKVSSKQAIGVVNTDEQEDKTVLKFQLWKDLQKIDPEQWILSR